MIVADIRLTCAKKIYRFCSISIDRKHLNQVLASNTSKLEGFASLVVDHFLAKQSHKPVTTVFVEHLLDFPGVVTVSLVPFDLT